MQNIEGKDKVKKHYKNNYTVADNKILQDERLSYLSVGIFMYLWSKPDDWKIVVNHLMKRNNTSEYQVRKALRELKEYGYMKWTRIQSGFLYEINDCGNFHCGDSHYNDIHYNDNQHNIYIQNKDNNKIKNNNKEKINKKENSLIKKQEIENNNFQEVWLLYKSLAKGKEGIKKLAEKSFKKHKHDINTLKAKINEYFNFIDKTSTETFNQTKMMSTWLNQECFLEDWNEKINNIKKSQQLTTQKQIDIIHYDKKEDIIYILNIAMQVYDKISPKQIKEEEMNILNDKLKQIKDSTLEYTLLQALSINNEEKLKKAKNMLLSAWCKFCENNDPAKINNEYEFNNFINNPIYQKQSFFCFVYTMANIDYKHRKDGIAKHEYFIDTLRYNQNMAIKQYKYLNKYILDPKKEYEKYQTEDKSI